MLSLVIRHVILSLICELSLVRWEIDHFCESSKSVEIFTGWRGWWWLVVTNTSLINHHLSCQSHCLYLIMCLIRMTVAGPAAVID